MDGNVNSAFKTMAVSHEEKGGVSRMSCAVTNTSKMPVRIAVRIGEKAIHLYSMTSGHGRLEFVGAAAIVLAAVFVLLARLFSP
ncbi:MAG: hypothetical protein ACPLRW_07450 [Moorellales bacterium]